MVNRDDIISFVNQSLGQEILEKAKIKDELANGVQILGTQKISKIAIGVSYNAQFLQEAVKWGAQMCICHHSLDFRFEKMRLPIVAQHRLRLVFTNNLSILGYHYALDAHHQLGNNAQIINQLGATIVEPLFQDWGFTAKFDKPISHQSLKAKLKTIFNKVSFFDTHRKVVSKIGVVSGAGVPGSEELEELKQKSVQVYISGETKESAPHKLLESGINYYLCGHYATEVFGVQALGDKIESHFGSKLKIKFIDIKNPI